MIKVSNLLLSLTKALSIIRGIIYSLAGTILLLLSSFQLHLSNPAILGCGEVFIRQVLIHAAVILCLGIMSIVNIFVTTIGLREHTKYNFSLSIIFSTLCILPIGVIGGILGIKTIPNKIETTLLNE